MSVNASGNYYNARHAVSYPLSTGTGLRNLNSVQFGTGSRASGNVKTGYNPFSYQGGTHRKMGKLG